MIKRLADRWRYHLNNWMVSEFGASRGLDVLDIRFKIHGIRYRIPAFTLFWNSFMIGALIGTVAGLYLLMAMSIIVLG